MTNRRANDIWQVKHLKGFTFVSVRVSGKALRTTSRQLHTREDVSLKVLVPGE